MLRIVVIVLLAANLLYFGWSHWVDSGQPELTAVAPRPAGAAKQTEPPPPPPCSTLGPFHDEALATTARQQLEQLGWGLLRREYSEQVSDGWWVYVPTRSAAVQARTLAAIRRSGLRDAVAMRDDAEFRVSVAVLSDEERAEELAARVQRLRLDALVSERRKLQPVIWFDLPGVAREILSDGRLAATGLPLDQLRIEACPPPEDPAPAGDPPASPQAAPANGGNAGTAQAETHVATLGPTPESVEQRRV
jgi:hypothetical protein